MPATAAATAAEINRINTFFPLMPRLGNRWASKRPFEDLTVAVNAHLTSLTAVLVGELALGGGRWVVTAANTATTDLGVVNWLREQGVAVYTGGDMRNRHLAALDHEPAMIADVGFELCSTLLGQRRDQVADVQAAVEITRTGITRLRQLERLPFGVVNLNDGRLKPSIENSHVGAGLWDSVRGITGMHMAGRHVAVVGYGAVGQGIAKYARAGGSVVSVVDTDPTQQLVAHYDGFATPTLDEAVRTAEILVTATGVTGAVDLDTLRKARSGLVLVNAGHGGDEIDVAGLPEISERAVDFGRLCTRYRLPGGAWLSVLGQGHPLNIVTNAGSPEPVLLHFATLGLTLEWLAGQRLTPGEHVLPRDIEREVATLALGALKGAR